jgi:crossover junction endodeoxyribonuclease RuvC
VVILGIDPGSVVTGYGVVACEGRERRLVDCGLLRPGSDLPFPKRLLRIYDDLLRLVADSGPDEVAIEAVFHGANVKTLMKMCHARGAIMVALANSDLPVSEYAPREVKKAVVGRGNASKEQVQFMVRQLFGMEERPETYDVSDALAVALCHANRGPLVAGSEKTGGGAGLADKLAAAGAYEPRKNRLEETLKSMGVALDARGRSAARKRGRR